MATQYICMIPQLPHIAQHQNLTNETNWQYLLTLNNTSSGWHSSSPSSIGMTIHFSWTTHHILTPQVIHQWAKSIHGFLAGLEFYFLATCTVISCHIILSKSVLKVIAKCLYETVQCSSIFGQTVVHICLLQKESEKITSLLHYWITKKN